MLSFKLHHNLQHTHTHTVEFITLLVDEDDDDDDEKYKISYLTGVCFETATPHSISFEQGLQYIKYMKQKQQQQKKTERKNNKPLHLFY